MLPVYKKEEKTCFTFSADRLRRKNRRFFSAFNISKQVDPTEKAAINHKYQQRVPCVSPLRLQLPGFGLVQLISSHVTSFSNTFPSWAKKKQCSCRVPCSDHRPSRRDVWCGVLHSGVGAFLPSWLKWLVSDEQGLAKCWSTLTRGCRGSRFCKNPKRV